MTATRRQLLARYQRGGVLTWAERLRCCPHRAVVTPVGIIREPTPEVGVSGGCFIIGSGDGTFTEAMREWVVEALREDRVILVAASEARLLSFALDQIGLEMMPPAGHA